MTESIYNIIKKGSPATNEMVPEPEMLDIFYSEFIAQNTIFDINYASSINHRNFWTELNNILIDNYLLKDTEIKTVTDLFKKHYVPISNEFLDKILALKKQYFSYLASEYSNGRNNDTITFLLKNKNIEFSEEIHFQQSLKQAIEISERKELKRKFELLDEASAFEITDNEITSAFQLLEKKNEYERLKDKMNEWDTAQTQTTISIPKPSRTIPLSFIRYAVAACFIGAMAWIGIRFYNDQPTENNLAANKSDSLKVPATIAPQPEFAKVEVSEHTLQLMKEHGLGYAPVETKLRIVINDLHPRIASMEKYIADKTHDPSDSGKVSSYVQSEIDSLKKLTKSYKFDSKSLQLFTAPDNNLKNTVLETTDNHYYYSEGDHFYMLQQSDKPIPFVKVTDKAKIDKLERVVFDNEK